MNKIKKLVSVAAAALVGIAFGKTDSVYEIETWGSVDKINYNSKGDVERGEWTSQFNKTFALAEKEGVPLMVFWGNDGCGHCAALESDMSGSTFTKWQKEYGIYMTFNIGGYSGPAGDEDEVWDAKSAAFDFSGEFPYIGVWWTNSKGKFDQLGTFTGNGLSAEQVISKVKGLLKGYSPNQGGQFAVSYKDETDTHRYEAEIVAKDVSVDVKFVREASAKNATGKDTVLVTDPSGKQIKKTTVSWEKGELEKTLAVKIPEGTFTKAGQKVTVAITKDDGKTAKDKTYIYAVSAENSPVNPDFKGCTKFGEWTMDIAAAKAYAAANGGLVLVCVQGSQWCPDCANVERNFLSLKADGKNRFQAWAEKQKLALVAIDVPNFESTTTVACSSPSLLKADPYNKALARESEYPQSGASEDELKQTAHSGLGYLSRKGISAKDAAAVLERNRKLVQTNTDKVAADGVRGFHRPEDTNANRTGVPIFVLLRADGTVAARLTRMAAVSPMKADQKNFDNYLKRIVEMQAIAAEDATEIENNYPSAGSVAVKVGASAKGQISNTDAQDSFRLVGVGGNARFGVKVSGASGAKVSVQLALRGADGAVALLGKPVEVAISKGKTVAASVTKPGECFAIVKAADLTSADFKVESAADRHFTDFTVTAVQPKAIPGEARTELFVSGGSVEIKVAKGKQYRITGLGETDSAKLAKVGDDTYLAKVSDVVKVPVAVAGSTIAYQLWSVGTVEFKNDEPKGGISESAGSWKITLVRSGAAGDCTARVRLNLKKTDYFYDFDAKTLPRFDVNGSKWPFEYVDVNWKDGDKSDKTITVNLLGSPAQLKKYYGDGQIVFDLEAIGTAGLGAKTSYTLKVKEDQKPAASVIAISRANPKTSTSRHIYARKSSKVKLAITRDGSYGSGGVSVATSESVKIAGTGYDAKKKFLSWDDRDDEDRILSITKLPKAGSTVKIEVKASSDKAVAKWFKIDSAKSAVKISSVADDAPEFEARSVTYTVARYVNVSKKIGYNSAYVHAGGKLGAKRLKGELPAGLTAKVKSNKLTITGAATAKQGSYAVCYVPREKVNGVTVSGIPIRVVIKVIDPTEVSAKDKTYGMYANASVAKSRTLDGLMVFAGTDPSRLAGLLKVSIPATGKVTAKYTCTGGTISFSATQWDSILTAPVTLSIGTFPVGTLVARPSVTTEGAKGYSLTVYAAPNGRVLAAVNDPVYEGDLGAYSDGKAWSASNSAEAWRGIYNTTLVPGGSKYYAGVDVYANLSGGITEPENKEACAPHGSGYLSFTMTDDDDCDAGRIRWAGMLPSGQSVSGSTVLTCGVDGFIGRSGYAYAPVFLKTGTDILSIVAEIKKDAASKGLSRVVLGSPDFASKTDGVPDLPLGFWEHNDATKGADASFSMDLHLFGSFYNPKQSLLKCCEKSYVKAEQVLLFDTVAKAGYNPDAKSRGTMPEVTPVEIGVGEGDIRILTSDKKNPNAVSVSFARATGIVTGTFVLGSEFKDGSHSTVEAKWRGVLLTGWGEECQCGEGGGDIYLPFICGGYSFKDTIPYKSGSKTKTAAVQNGGFAYSVERE